MTKMMVRMARMTSDGCYRVGDRVVGQDMACFWLEYYNSHLHTPQTRVPTLELEFHFF